MESLSLTNNDRCARRSVASRRTKSPRRRGVRPWGKVPPEIVEQAAELGLTGANIPVEYGGVGYDTLTNAIIAEELFAVDPGIGLCVQSAAFGSDAVIGFGTDEQKERFLEPVATGDAVMGAAISEPHAGSDVSSVSTSAEKEGDEWVLDGTKMWITNGSVGDYFVVLCETDPDAEGRYKRLLTDRRRVGPRRLRGREDNRQDGDRASTPRNSSSTASACRRRT